MQKNEGFILGSLLLAILVALLVLPRIGRRAHPSHEIGAGEQNVEASARQEAVPSSPAPMQSPMVSGFSIAKVQPATLLPPAAPVAQPVRTIRPPDLRIVLASNDAKPMPPVPVEKVAALSPAQSELAALKEQRLLLAELNSENLALAASLRAEEDALYQQRQSDERRARRLEAELKHERELLAVQQAAAYAALHHHQKPCPEPALARNERSHPHHTPRHDPQPHCVQPVLAPAPPAVAQQARQTIENNQRAAKAILARRP